MPSSVPRKVGHDASGVPGEDAGAVRGGERMTNTMNTLRRIAQYQIEAWFGWYTPARKAEAREFWATYRREKAARIAERMAPIESAFAVMKRGIIGVYHHISPKHTGRYMDEFAFRLNDGNVKRHTLNRLDSFVDGMAQKRLTYQGLIQ